jgi:hypothetical protein
MLSNNKFIVLHPEAEFSDKDVVVFLDTVAEVHELLIKLHAIKTKTNQPMTEFTYVFAKGSLYPAEYDAFWAARRADRRRYSTGASFFLQRPIRRGVKQKHYDFAEDFDWQFDKWVGQDVIILDLNEARTGEYVYSHDIEKRWGDKEPLLKDDSPPVPSAPVDHFPLKSYRDLAIAIGQLSEEQKDQPIRFYEPNEESELFTIETNFDKDGDGHPFLDFNFKGTEYIDR